MAPYKEIGTYTGHKCGCPAVNVKAYPSTTPGSSVPVETGEYLRLAPTDSFSWSRVFHKKFRLVALSALAVLLVLAALRSCHRPVQSSANSGATWGGREWEKQVKLSAEVEKNVARLGEGGQDLQPRSWRGGNDLNATVSAPLQEGGRIVLVTGAAGFIGHHVSLALKNRGDGVVGIDNFNSYYPVALKRARQGNLVTSNIFVVEGDVNDEFLLAKLFQLVRFTHVLHLAAQAGVRYAVHNPQAYVASNIAGFVSMLEACKKASPQPTVVFASSSSVYGLNSKVPFSEDDRTDKPASLYAATKKADELLAHTYTHIYGLSITALRFFTVYGPWGRPDMAYFSFTRNILNGQPVRIFRGPCDAELARDFTYIDDVVKGCLAALDTSRPRVHVSDTRKPSVCRRKAPFRVYNIGNTQPVKVGEFVKVLEAHLGVAANREYIRMPWTGDVMFTHANVTKAKRDLGYTPSTNLTTGLSQFVEWYKGYYQKGGVEEKSMVGYLPY